MTYITGTMPADINPGAALAAIFEVPILAAGHTLEDTVVIGAQTFKLYKSAAANNSSGKDWWWHLFYTTTGAGTIGGITHEDFNTTTNLVFRRVDASDHPTWATTPTLANQYAVTTASGAAGTTGVALNARTQTAGGSSSPWADGGAGVSHRQVSAPTGTTVGYWFSVTGDRFAFVTSPTPAAVIAGGVYTPHADQVTKFGAVNIVPVYSIGVDMATATATSIANGRSVLLTRAPGVAGVTSNGYAELRGERLGTGYTPFPDPGTWTEPATARRAELRMQSSYSGVFGHLTGIKVFRNNIANITRGDTITIDGVSHFLATTPQGVETLAIAAV